MHSPTMEEYEAFGDYYAESKQRIDERIKEVIEGREEFDTKRKILSHATQGGKRIRPVLTMLTGDIYDAPLDNTLNHATIVELIHSASLVADDRADSDDMRRGMPTVWRVLEKIPGRVGNRVTTAMTIMAENGLMALALELADDPDVVRAMGQGTRKLVDGFFMEGKDVMSGVFGGGYDRYVEMNKAKTGSLFALAAWMPATAVDAPEEQVDAARKYGETTGILYQIADDIVDGDIPSYISDPSDELEKWYAETVSHAEEMPPDDKKDLAYVAPAFMVGKMLQGEPEAERVDVAFLPDGALSHSS